MRILVKSDYGNIDIPYDTTRIITKEVEGKTVSLFINDGCKIFAVIETQKKNISQEIFMASVTKGFQYTITDKVETITDRLELEKYKW